MDALKAAQQGAALELERARNGQQSNGAAEKTDPRRLAKVTKPEPEKSRISEEKVIDAVEQANEFSQMFDRGLKFEYRKEAEIYQVSVIDTSRDEVVRKIPPDEVVRFIERVKDMFGAMLDVQA